MLRKEFFEFEQTTIIENYNKLVDVFQSYDIKFNKMSEDGSCNELVFAYALAASQQQRIHFLLFLAYINSLNNEQGINTCVENYIRNDLIEVLFQDEKWTINLKSELTFLESIHNLSRDNQNIKLIGAHWEKTHTFICSTNLFVAELKRIQLKEGDIALISLGIHIFYIEKMAEGFYLFETNNVKKPAYFPLLKSEDELGQQIIENCEWLLSKQENPLIAFTMQFISFKEKNKALDTIIQSSQDKIKNKPRLYYLMKQHQHGEMSDMDFALALYRAIDMTKQHWPALKKLLHAYVEDEIAFLNDTLVRYSSYIIENAYTKMISWLFLAAKHNQIVLTEALLAKGALINQVTNDGVTSLYMATKGKHIDIMSLLIAKGASIHQADKDGVSPLFIAAELGYIDIVKLLIKKGANIHQTNQLWVTPLHIAVQNGHFEIVKIFIKQGANVNQKTQDGTTPLYTAAQEGCTEIVKLLVKNNANSDISCKSTKEGLHAFAEVCGNKNVAMKFIKEKSNTSNDEIDILPEDIANMMGYTDIALYLRSMRPLSRLSTSNPSIFTKQFPPENLTHETRNRRHSL